MNTKQTSKNLADIARGAYHGSIGTALSLREAVKDSIDELIGSMDEKAKCPALDNHIANIPNNKYGTISAIAGSLCTLVLAGGLLYEGIKMTTSLVADNMLRETPSSVYITGTKDKISPNQAEYDPNSNKQNK